MAKELKAPELMNYAMFCGGCGHGVLLRLICECLEEYGLDKKTIAAIGVGCSCHLTSGINVDLVQSPHGRAAAVATGIRRAEPDKFVFSYQGDGDAYNIGLAETLNAAYRNENICVFTINNGNFGMSGGQMAPTTLPHQKTATSPMGKDPARYGTLNVVAVLGKMDIAYLARGELVGPAGMNNSKKLIRTAFEHQLNGDGFCLVELLSPCPTNLNMPPVKAREHVHTEMTKYFPVGEYIDKKGGDQA